MILGINGLRLVGKRSGVGRAIEAFLVNLGRLDHPFSEIRVYTPRPLDRPAIGRQECRSAIETPPRFVGTADPAQGAWFQKCPLLSELRDAAAGSLPDAARPPWLI